jgi:quercetin dioxygenase-like cupin family protein
MSYDFSVRRIVTGHDPEGRAVIKEDERVPSQTRFIEKADGNKDIFSVELWATDQLPANNDDARIKDHRAGGWGLPPAAKGQRSQFRIVTIPPRQSSPMHRTESIDYGLLLDGTCALVLDSGNRVSCEAGDVVVQRGTIHAWINDSDAPCRWMWVLIDAAPVEIGDRRLCDEWRQAPPLAGDRVDNPDAR